LIGRRSVGPEISTGRCELLALGVPICERLTALGVLARKRAEFVSQPQWPARTHCGAE